MLSHDEAARLVDSYMQKHIPPIPLQHILDEGDVPALKGYVVRPGKVSDSIFGGAGNFTVDAGKEPAYDAVSGSRIKDMEYFEVEEKGKTKKKVRISFENPPLERTDSTPIRLMVRTQRISTHDILRGEIPFKDQVLALNHNFMLRLLAPFIGTSQYDVGLADNSIVIASENLKQIPFENVLRAYMARSTTSTSLYVHFMGGKREFCGHRVPDGLVPNGQLPYVMDTPSTKSDEHDISVSPQQLFDNGICTPEQYTQIRNSSIFAFGAVYQFLYPRGILAVDTKTEHGINSGGQIVSQDETWTFDSSRMWLVEDYNKQLELFLMGDEEGLRKYLEETQPGIKENDFLYNNGSRIAVGMAPRSYSKEFARGLSVDDRGYTQEQSREISLRYIDGIQKLLGIPFNPDRRSYERRASEGLKQAIERLSL